MKKKDEEMVSVRVFCCLLMFFTLQLYAKVSNANFSSQAPQAANSEGLGASTNTHTANKAMQDVIETRKTLKHVSVNVEAHGKNGLEIKSKETMRRRKNKKRLAKTVSLTADYSDPGHHPPRHN